MHRRYARYRQGRDCRDSSYIVGSGRGGYSSSGRVVDSRQGGRRLGVGRGGVSPNNIS